MWVTMVTCTVSLAAIEGLWEETVLITVLHILNLGSSHFTRNQLPLNIRTVRVLGLDLLLVCVYVYVECVYVYVECVYVSHSVECVYMSVECLYIYIC